MNLKSILRGAAPLAALAFAATATSGCGKLHVSIDGDEGKPLSELDLSGEAPTRLALMGPDTVRIVTGERLAITIDGDAKAAEDLRFTLEDGKLGILRKHGSWSRDDRTVTVNVTMPAPRKLAMAGSGKIIAPELGGPEAKVSIAGSGSIDTDRVAVDTLNVSLAGSGTFHTAGTARALKLSIAGSGDARLDALKVEEAKVSIAGSGDGAFASDGQVKASIVGSGIVRVIGRATCKVSSVGSGSLVCENPA
jgi:hypothetical protein